MSFLTRTYPFKQSKHWLRDSVLYGIVIWAILYLLQPFGFSAYQGNKCVAAAIFGLVTTGCYAFYGWAVIGRLPQRIKPWRIWHHACVIIGLTLFIAVCNFLTVCIVFDSPFYLQFFLLSLYWTFIIGIFITVVSIIIQYNRFLKDNMEALLNKTTAIHMQATWRISNMPDCIHAQARTTMTLPSLLLRQQLWKVHWEVDTAK